MIISVVAGRVRIRIRWKKYRIRHEKSPDPDPCHCFIDHVLHCASSVNGAKGFLLCDWFSSLLMVMRDFSLKANCLNAVSEINSINHWTKYFMLKSTVTFKSMHYSTNIKVWLSSRFWLHRKSRQIRFFLPEKTKGVECKSVIVTGGP